MESEAEAVRIGTGNGEMPAHLARPAAPGRYPGVIVVMEAFGLNDHIRAVAERIAREGYVTLAPDLYHRFGSPVVPYADVPTAIQWMRRLEPAGVVADIGAAVRALKGRAEVRADRLGITGFCMGGTVALRSAAHHPGDIAAAVAFYGGASLAGDLDLLGRIRAPLLGLWGQEDDLVPLDQVRRLEEAMRRLGKVYESRVYSGAGHGFFCDARGSYHAPSARDAWALLVGWFFKYLN